MNRTQLIESIANTAQLSKKSAALAWDAIVDSITNALSQGDSVQLVGFGTFEVRDYAAREGRNPATGESISIPARKAPVFKAGKSLKEAVNDKSDN
ncbi:MAG: HU family DNA-binding protein [Pseudomonadota bacterium]